MTRFTGLELSLNSVSDVSALAGLTALELLFLDFNKVADLTPLGNLDRLFRLRANSNLIRRIETLLEIELLVTVDLRDNPLDADGLQAILEALDLAKVRVAL